MVRISSAEPNTVVVVTEGAREGEWGVGNGEVEMEDAEEA